MEQARQVFDEPVAALGGLDVIVNLAGAERTHPAETIDDEHWDMIAHVNARGVMNTNQAAFRRLREKVGRSSTSAPVRACAEGLVGRPYSASKGAVLAHFITGQTLAVDGVC